MKKLHPISPQDLAKMGRGGDTMLAHINPQEAQMLKRMGGSGTINPKTGLPEFMFADSDFNYMQADGGGSGGWDWYDGGGVNDSFGNDWYDSGTDFGNQSPVTGGGAVDQGINPDTGAVKMDFTGMAPGVPDVVNPNGPQDFGPGPTFPPAIELPPESTYTVPDLGPYTPLDVTPGELPDWYKDTNTTADNYTPNSYTPIDTGPEITVPDFTPPTIDAPSVDTLLPDLTPYIPNDVISPVIPEMPEMTITDTRPDVTPDDVPEMTITDNRPVAPDNIPEMPEMTITDTRPVVEDNVPEITITDDRPVKPVEPDVPEITITDDRPVKPVEPDVPEITITDDRPVKPVEPEIPEITIVDDRPVKPVEPDVPEITITDDRPVKPVEPPEPPIVEPPPPEPPVIEPPIVEPPEPPLPPIVPPVVPPVPPVVPPIVEPPVVPPTPPVAPVVPQTGEMINPGWIQAQPFYNTSNAAQSKFFWGGHGPQFTSGNPAEPFNAQAYNQVAAPETPWGLGQVATALTPAEIQQIIQGTYQGRPGTAPATRATAYKAPTQAAPSYGQVQVGGPTAPIAPTAPKTGTTKDLYTADQKTAITQALGSDWQSRLDKAALNGDYATIVDIQRQIDSILNPTYEQP